MVGNAHMCHVLGGGWHSAGSFLKELFESCMMYLVVFLVENPGMVSGRAYETTRESLHGLQQAAGPNASQDCVRTLTEKKPSSVSISTFSISVSQIKPFSPPQTEMPDHQEGTISRLVLTSRLHVLLE
jgi:hypothetical protein